MAVPPRFSQHTFNHMRNLIRKINDRAVNQDDADTSIEAKLLDSLLLLFVEDLILDDTIIVQDVKVQGPLAYGHCDRLQQQNRERVKTNV
jgi:hypothetical protein